MEDYGKPGFEAKPDNRTQAIANKGEITYAEKHPADPLKDDLTKMLSHRGGQASPRTEFY